MGTSRSCGYAQRSTELIEAEDNSLEPNPDRSGAPPLRSFGRRRGRKLSPRQASLLSTGLEEVAVDLRERPGNGRLASLFSEPVREVWLEIGFGAGEHLVWQAEHNPNVGVIGAEPYINGVVAALSAMEERRLRGRVRIHTDDVHSLLDWLPGASLSRAFMLFPDPWPKKRHRARRLFSPSLLSQMARVLQPGTEFRFASDILDYAEAAIEHAKSHPDFELSETFTAVDRNAVTDWPRTRYEAKAATAGRSSIFIILRRKAAA
jgi:tRNA (guanine-N7-)-methyltransferase